MTQLRTNSREVTLTDKMNTRSRHEVLQGSGSHRYWDELMCRSYCVNTQPRRDNQDQNDSVFFSSTTDAQCEAKELHLLLSDRIGRT